MTFFVSGYRTLEIPKDAGAAFLNLCADYGLVYREAEDPKAREEGRLRFCVSELTARRLLGLLRSAEIPFEDIERGGLWTWLCALGKRPGRPVGALCFALLLFVFSGVLWDIRIDGCVRLREQEVRDLLSECGLRTGLWRSAVDTATIENRVMILSDDVSWLSINIIGTVAQVELRETAPILEAEPPMAAANLVAERDGQILWMEEVRGNAAVMAGDTVSEGQLLVGGLYGSETDGFRYTVAKGKVFAETARSLEVKIPLQYEKKVYTGRIFTEKYFIFFEKEVKFFGKCGNLYGSCDTIDTTEYFSVFEGEDLPVGIRTVRYLEYETVQAERTEAEAAALARYRLGLLSERETEGAELLSFETWAEIGEGVYRLRMHATYIEDIAAVREIPLEGVPFATGTARRGRSYGASNCEDRAHRADRTAVRQL